MNKLLLLTVILFSGLELGAQVLDIDRENEQDSIKKKVRASIDFNLSIDKQRRNLLDLTNRAEFSVLAKKNTVFIFVGSSELTLNGKSTIENNGYVQIRFRDNDSRKLFPDFFTQYQWNGIQGMEYRAIGGGNLRIQWMEKKKSDLYSSLGIFYEREKWNPFLGAFAFSADSLQVVNREMFRLNTVFKFAFQINESLDIAGVSYIQFPINQYFLEPRWFLDLNLNIPIAKHLSFVVHYEHNYDSYRPLPIDEFFFAMTLGCRLTW
jgi:hypothetical protein